MMSEENKPPPLIPGKFYLLKGGHLMRYVEHSSRKGRFYGIPDSESVIETEIFCSPSRNPPGGTHYVLRDSVIREIGPDDIPWLRERVLEAKYRNLPVTARETRIIIREIGEGKQGSIGCSTLLEHLPRTLSLGNHAAIQRKEKR